MEFIERIEASSLNLSEEEFERYMSGEALPPGGGWEGGVWLCEGMRLLRQSTKALHDLSQREEKLFTHAVELKQEMLLFQVCIMQTLSFLFLLFVVEHVACYLIVTDYSWVMPLWTPCM